MTLGHGLVRATLLYFRGAAFWQKRFRGQAVRLQETKRNRPVNRSAGRKWFSLKTLSYFSKPTNVTTMVGQKLYEKRQDSSQLSSCSIDVEESTSLSSKSQLSLFIFLSFIAYVMRQRRSG